MAPSLPLYYPEAKPAPDNLTEYKPDKPSNPVLSGYALGIASKLLWNSSTVQSIFYHNANFPALRDLNQEGGPLREYTPRFDPTIIPAPTEGSINGPAPLASEPGRKNAQHLWTARDYVQAYTKGDLTPLQVAEKIISVIDEDELHRLAFIFVEREPFLKAAKESTERYKSGQVIPGGLDGVPFAVKDEVWTKDCPLMLGTDTVQATPTVNSWCVEKLIESGACLVGKTNMHELGLDTINNNINHGTPRNPYNTGFYCGGSSGGSGYVLGAGLVPIAIGCDGGGSIRIPSAYNGVYGLKPTHGRISIAPTPSIDVTVGVVGPMAASVADLELAYRVMAGPNPSDSISSQFSTPATHPNVETTRKKYIGIFKPYFEDCQPEVLESMQSAVAQLELNGYEVVDITIPLISIGQRAHAITILSEISHANYDPKTNFSPANKILMGVISRAPHSDFILAQKVRNLLMQHVSALYKKYPGLLIITPTTPSAGVKIGAESHCQKGGYGVSDANASLASMRYVFLANFCGVPSMSIPVGYTEDTGMPIALMATAEWGYEEECFEVARTLESSFERKRGVKWVDILGDSQS